MIIRRATKDVLADLVYLMGELGYPTTREKLEHRFSPIFASGDYHILVAEREGKAIGKAGCHTATFYEYDGSYLRLASFVVSPAY